MTNNIVHIHKEVTADSLLTELQGNFTDVVVIGWNKENRHSMFTSKELSIAELNLLLDLAKQRLL